MIVVIAFGCSLSIITHIFNCILSLSSYSSFYHYQTTTPVIVIYYYTSSLIPSVDTSEPQHKPLSQRRQLYANISTNELSCNISPYLSPLSITSSQSILSSMPVYLFLLPLLAHGSLQPYFLSSSTISGPCHYVYGYCKYGCLTPLRKISQLCIE